MFTVTKKSSHFLLDSGVTPSSNPSISASLFWAFPSLSLWTLSRAAWAVTMTVLAQPLGQGLLEGAVTVNHNLNFPAPCFHLSVIRWKHTSKEPLKERRSRKDSLEEGLPPLVCGAVSGGLRVDWVPGSLEHFPGPRGHLFQDTQTRDNFQCHCSSQHKISP